MKTLDFKIKTLVGKMIDESTNDVHMADGLSGVILKYMLYLKASNAFEDTNILTANLATRLKDQREMLIKEGE